MSHSCHGSPVWSVTSQLNHQTMWNKSVFFRLMTLVACLAWGLLEFLALQRARIVIRRIAN